MIDPTPIDLVCPKCHGRMRPHERQGIVVDLCTECRGIYLDRGELDRLLDLEASVQRRYATAPVVHPDRPSDAGWRRDRDDDDDDWHERRGGTRRRRGGFLGELLEGFGD